MEKKIEFFDIEKINDRHTNPSFSMSLYNIGLGVAKHINIVWSFDIEYFINYFTMYCPEEMNFYFDDDYDSNLLLKTETSISQLKGLNHNYYFEYLKNNDDSVIALDFSSAWLFFEFKYNINSGDKLNEILENFQKLPKLEMNIKYTDISNKNYNKKYFFDFSIIGFSKKEIALDLILNSKN